MTVPRPHVPLILGGALALCAPPGSAARPSAVLPDDTFAAGQPAPAPVANAAF
jgi:hypothetical protein